MPENMDVTKMKVADLKRELKLRGLSITGNKTELAERLQASDFSFEDTTISGEDLLEDEDAVLTDEEKILDENELLKSPRGGTIDKSNIKDLFVPIEDVSSSTIGTTTTTAAAAKKVVLKRKIGMATNDVSLTNAVKENTANTKLIKLSDNTIDATKEKSKTDDVAVSAAVAAGPIKQVTKLSAQERLELRAKKFGLTPTTNPIVGSTNANKNAVVAESDNSAKSLPTAINNEKEAELLKKRAERFGCVVSSKMVQLDAAERLQKRKERFGGGGAAAATTTTTTKVATVSPIIAVASTGTSDVWAEKARLRLERFKTNKTASATASPTTPSAAAATTINATN